VKLKEIEQFLIKDIEKHLTSYKFKLEASLRATKKYSDEELPELVKTSSKLGKWFDELKKNRQKDLYDADFKLIYFIDNEEHRSRKYLKEFKGCMHHHLTRCFNCNTDRGFRYQFFRFACCCCWTSYIWQLGCSRLNEQHELFACIACLPFYICYLYDSLNFETKKSFNEEMRTLMSNGMANDSSHPNVQQQQQQQQTATLTSAKNNLEMKKVITNQPIPFHYSTHFYKSFIYAAFVAELNEPIGQKKFIVWIKLPFDYRLDVGYST
jgi:hypothetical protein